MNLEDNVDVCFQITGQGWMQFGIAAGEQYFCEELSHFGSGMPAMIESILSFCKYGKEAIVRLQSEPGDWGLRILWFDQLMRIRVDAGQALDRWGPRDFQEVGNPEIDFVCRPTSFIAAVLAAVEREVERTSLEWINTHWRSERLGKTQIDELRDLAAK